MHVSLSSFLKFLSANGTKKASVVRELRRQYDDESRSGRSFYAEFDRVVCQWFADRPKLVAELEAVMQQAEAAATSSSWASAKPAHYRALTEGALDLQQRLRPTSAVKERGQWVSGTIEITVPYLLVNTKHGQQALFLHYKEDGLSTETANTVLYVLRSVVSDLSVSVHVVDVRRAKIYNLKTRPSLAILKRTAEGEARFMSELWDGLAAA